MSPAYLSVKFTKSFVFRPVAAAILAIGLLASGAVRADDYAEVNRLLRAGQLAEAIVKADQYLGAKPRDAQMRFLKGVIFTEQGKPTDAIGMFTKLTEDYPELPEPYNNLAVLYAGQSQFDKARAALEMAIRTNPSYATAHENLGDVYAKLASQAYSKALQLDSANTGVQPKLSLIRDLFSTTAKNTRPTSVAAAPTAPVKSSVAPVAPAPVAALPVKPAAVVPQAPSSPVALPAVSSAGDEQAVNAAVQNWAAAWSGKKMGDYLGAYGKDFDAPGGRKTWESERTKRIMGKNKISVKLTNMAVTIAGNTAKARFKQDYDADSLSVTSTKTLSLAKIGDRWVIVKESSGG